MNTIDEKQIIEYLIYFIQVSIEELNQTNRLYSKNDFCTGQLYAYVECLEVLQLCPLIQSKYLNYNIEKRYPIK